MSDKDIKTFVRFVHNSIFMSKELVEEELGLVHREIVSNWAQVHRKLALIAREWSLKKGGGVIWETRDAFLKSLGLKDPMVSVANINFAFFRLFLMILKYL